MRPSIIVDIDGTIANCEHRLHHIVSFKDDAEATFKADWDAFYEECHRDEPLFNTISLVQALIDQDWAIILITGRAGKYRRQTETWLEQNDIFYDLMLMRKHGDHSEDVVIKKAWLKQLRNGQIAIRGVLPPRLVIEDRKCVVEMWREEGLTCLQCAEGDF